MQHDRDLVADRAVWPNFVVVSTPILQLLPTIFKAQEPVRVHAFLSEPTIESLNEGIIRRFSGTAEVENHATLVGP